MEERRDVLANQRLLDRGALQTADNRFNILAGAARQGVHRFGS
jgi:hypothetical protein